MLRRTVLSAALLGVLVAPMVFATLRNGGDPAPDTHLATRWRDEPGAAGTLSVLHFGAAPGSARPRRQRTELVNGGGYAAMEDNDLRGYLDGTFKYGWNQPGQIHVRIGRRGEAPRFGEYELFRVLQRWDSVALPPLARVTAAELRIQVEEGPEAPVRVMLYAVRKDWDPGRGGTALDNVSPPNPGEVWWNDAAFARRAWGLPGVSFASPGDPEADLDPMPLAQTTYQPGASRIVLSSARLADYVTERAGAGEPLLFLLKLSDYHEDLPGSLLTLHSGNQGDSRNPARRPRLVLDWESPAQSFAVEVPVVLEYGRTYRLPRLAAHQGAWHGVGFDVAPGYEAPLVQVRGGKDGEESPWRDASRPFAADWDWMEVRLVAASNPVVLGEAFEAEFRDTWVRSAPPEDQEVLATFVSPGGVRHVVRAAYLGGNRWRFGIVPDELGPWSYQWTQSFTGVPYRSGPGSFDVVGGDRENVREQIHAFALRLRSLDLEDPEVLSRSMVQLARLERSAMLQETPRTFRSAEGRRLRDLLNEARAILGEPAPAVIPLVPDRGAPRRPASSGGSP